MAYGKSKRSGSMPKKHKGKLGHPVIGTSTPHPPMPPSDSMLDSSEHPGMPDLGDSAPPGVGGPMGGPGG